MVTLTERAAAKVRALAQSRGGARPVLRVKVGAGGCSGMSYQFDVEEDVRPDDLVSETSGVRAAVDPRSDFFIGGSVVDYEESLMKSGFKVTNPLAKSSCSCGASFNV